ncbi:DUF317 domain-containing protein [Streptomyces sp. NBC_00272]|uniref:DUF317 domain-containing protein n=1 Tax=Streptomyces sp. NBC_00272 TaxID=2975698 RepID=UPI002E2D2FB1|nr:DUF317 domain-containing protein [Streptomyces sp. NBC_00272]
MPHASADAQIRFTLHPDHHPAVIATTSGSTSDAARSHLHDLGFRSIGPDAMVLARIDHEEPYYANTAAKQLSRYGFTVEIETALQDEIDTEWTWGNYPFPWCTRDEVRGVSADAQRIHDDIAEGRLIIHLHANDGNTTVAVGTYTSGARRHVHLHGENHVRQVAMAYEDETEAVAEFHRLYTVAVRPGPAPLTDREQASRQALQHGLRLTSNPGSPRTETTAKQPTNPTAPPSAGPGEHEAFLAAFLESNAEWEKYRTWDDDTTVSNHESLTVRAEFDHEARHRTDTAWTLAAYNGPVGERIWHATVTAATPVAFVHAVLESASSTGAPLADSSPHGPLREADWTTASHPGGTTWRAPNRSITFEHLPHATDDQWIVYGGNDPNRHAWAIRLSAGAPEYILAELTSTAAEMTLPHTPRQPTPLPRVPAAPPQLRTRVR